MTKTEAWLLHPRDYQSLEGNRLLIARMHAPWTPPKPSVYDSSKQRAAIRARASACDRIEDDE